MQEKNKSFEKSMVELENIVRALEEGNIPLAEMMALYEKGMGLGRQCLGILEEYEGKIATLALQKPGMEEYDGDE